MEKLKWGIAAAGRITHDFVNALCTIEGAMHVVVAVADVDLQLAHDFAQRHQIARYYENFDELAQDAEVQIIYIGTLNPYHYAVARLMLERGKHVLCEHPLCLHYAQADKLYNLSKRKNLFLMEGMWSRCFASYQHLKELLNAGVIGTVTYVQVEHGYCAANMERILTRALGGSITLEIGSYALQLGQLIYACAPLNIETKATLNADGVDVETEIVMDYGNKRILKVKLSANKKLNNTAYIKGTNGELKLPNYWCCTSLYKSNNQLAHYALPLEAAKFKFNYTNACGLRYEAEEVRKCIEKCLYECPLYTHAQSLQILQIEAQILRQIGVNHADVTIVDL